MLTGRRQCRRAFTLLEVVIVAAIIAVLAAIAIPRMSRGAKGATSSALSDDLAVLRKAIDLYAAEHDAYPTVAAIESQLTQYTDIDGAASQTMDATHIYGPYVHSIPPLPVGARKGQTGIAAADANDVGWIYIAAGGRIRANTTTERDTVTNLLLRDL